MVERRSVTCCCNAAPVSIWWPETRISIVNSTPLMRTLPRETSSGPDRSLDPADEYRVACKFLRRRRLRARCAEGPVAPRHFDGGDHASVGAYPRQLEPDLAPAGQLDIDLRQQLGVEQRAVLDPVAAVDAVAGAQRVERQLG